MVNRVNRLNILNNINKTLIGTTFCGIWSIYVFNYIITDQYDHTIRNIKQDYDNKIAVLRNENIQLKNTNTELCHRLGEKSPFHEMK